MSTERSTVTCTTHGVEVIECSNCLQCDPGNEEKRDNSFLSNLEQRTENVVGLQPSDQASVRIRTAPSTRNEVASSPEQSSSAITARLEAGALARGPTPITAPNAPARTPLRPPSTAAQTHFARKPYTPPLNGVGKPQIYAMNRFLDEIPDVRSLALMPNEQLALERNNRHRAALKTRLRGLEVMIGV